MSKRTIFGISMALMLAGRLAVTRAAVSLTFSILSEICFFKAILQVLGCKGRQKTNMNRRACEKNAGLCSFQWNLYSLFCYFCTFKTKNKM